MIKIDILNFGTYEELAYKIADDFNSITDEMKDVSVVAKYEDARKILAELICLGYQIGQIHSLEDSDWDGYCDEYIITLSDFDGASVWCEPFMRNGEYFYDDSVIAYIFDNCNSKCLKKMKNTARYVVSIGCDNECDCENCDCTDECKEYSGTTDDGAEFHISVKGDLDLDEAMAKLDEVEARMGRINESLSEMDIFRKLFNW